MYELTAGVAGEGVVHEVGAVRVAAIEVVPVAPVK